MVIDQSCDLNYSALKASAMAFANSGQTCIRSDYVLIHHTLAEGFISKLQANMEAVYAKGTKKASLGKVINKFHKDRCC